MARTSDRRRKQPSKQPQKKPALVWRPTQIRLWRDKADLSQQEVADKLIEMDPKLDYTRVSVQRIETGNQRPPVMVLEAMVKMFDAPDLTSMLDRTPEEAEEYRQILALEPKERRRLLRLLKAAKDEEEQD